MKRMIYLVAIVAALAGMVACGPSAAEKAERLASAAAQIDSIVKCDEAPVVSSGARYEDPNIVVSYVLSDSMIKVDLLGDELLDYYAAEELRTMDASTLKTVTSLLSKNETSLVVSITDVYGNAKNYIFTADKLKNLAKAKRSTLNVQKVKEQVVALANASVPAPYAHPGTQVSASIDGGFLTYTIVWPKKSSYASYSQGVLVSLYKAPLQAQYSALGVLEYPVVDMYKSLGVDGVRIVYKAVDSDSELKQAFPWRELFK